MGEIITLDHNKPYSSIAFWYLYWALDSGLTITEFYLYK